MCQQVKAARKQNAIEFERGSSHATFDFEGGWNTVNHKLLAWVVWIKEPKKTNAGKQMHYGKTSALYVEHGFSNHLRPLQHRMQQHIAPRRNVLWLSVFNLVVADAVLARYEDHSAGSQLGHVDRIVAGA